MVEQWKKCIANQKLWLFQTTFVWSTDTKNAQAHTHTFWQTDMHIRGVIVVVVLFFAAPFTCPSFGIKHVNCSHKMVEMEHLKSPQSKNVLHARWEMRAYDEKRSHDDRHIWLCVCVCVWNVNDFMCVCVHVI